MCKNRKKPELNEIQVLEIAIDLSKTRMQVFRDYDLLSAYSEELVTLMSLRNQLDEIQKLYRQPPKSDTPIVDFIEKVRHRPC